MIFHGGCFGWLLFSLVVECERKNQDADLLAQGLATVIDITIAPFLDSLIETVNSHCPLPKMEQKIPVKAFPHNTHHYRHTSIKPQGFLLLFADVTRAYIEPYCNDIYLVIWACSSSFIIATSTDAVCKPRNQLPAAM